MPHFVIDCSPQVLAIQSPEVLLREIHDTAQSTGLFRDGDIKVRINPYTLYTFLEIKIYQYPKFKQLTSVINEKQYQQHLLYLSSLNS